ncbi:P-loop NTPase [Thermodesulfobacteriota bacterium]
MAHTIQDKIIESSLSKIRNKILVMSGKGGVGKSSIAANLAVGLAKRRYRVGLMDVDLHGPSIARIMGITGMLEVEDGFLQPWPFRENLAVVSLQALMPQADHAVIWRGPAKTGVIRQFIADVQWGELDYLVIDSPPGTGDEPLTVAQVIPDAQAVIIATPQELALADVRKSINFCQTVNMRILGLIENMGMFRCPHCGKPIELFPCGAGKATARTTGTAFLGSIPLDPQVVKACDQGTPVLDLNSKSPFSVAIESILDSIVNSTG